MPLLRQPRLCHNLSKNGISELILPFQPASPHFHETKAMVMETANPPFKKFLSRIFVTAIRNVEYFDRRRVALGSIGIVAFPLYYIVWWYMFPQAYENLALRLFGAGLFVPLVFSNYWTPAQRHYLPHLWHFALLFSLPFFFTSFLKTYKTYLSIQKSLTKTFLATIV